MTPCCAGGTFSSRCSLHTVVFAEPAEANIDLLDQMTMMDTSDQEALDDFLNSADVDVGSGSSVTSG